MGVEAGLICSRGDVGTGGRSLVSDQRVEDISRKQDQQEAGPAGRGYKSQKTSETPPG